VRTEILNIMRRNKVEGAAEILGNPDTAVVMVTGLIPMGINKGERFDLEIRALPSTDTTSLEGGFLLECDLTRVLSARGVEAKSEVLALGRGSIFVSPASGSADTFGDAGSAGTSATSSAGIVSTGARKTGDPRVGRIIGGGKATKTRSFQLSLFASSYRIVDQIARMVNTRFPGAAKGNGDSRVDLTAPREYQDDKGTFLDVVGSLYLREGAAVRDQRVDLLIQSLTAGKDMDRVSVCLEAFGPSVAPRLHALCEDPKEAIRFYAGRTLAGLQDARAINVLDRILMDDKSEFQEQAAEAVGRLHSGAGLGILSRALNVKSARVRVAAWQAMLRLSPLTTVVKRYEDKFSLSLIPTRGEPLIYVSRTVRPHIAIFGDAQVRTPVLAETARVTASAVAGASKIRLITHYHDHDVQIDSPLDIRAIIDKLTMPIEPPLTADGSLPDRMGPPQGLGLGYSDVVGLLNELSRKRALTVPVMLQPLKLYVTGDRPVLKPIETSEENP
jgi:hypothetical protein